MTRFSIAGAFPLLLGAAFAAAAQTPTASPAPAIDTPTVESPSTTFRGSVDLVAMKVTVTDPSDRYVQGLTQSDFVLLEDGVAQNVSVFAASKVPVDLAILFDMSASMAEKLSLVRGAAVGFVRSLGPRDRAAIIGFNDRVQVLQDFTGDVGRLDAAIATTTARGGTALHNALYITLRAFEKERAPDGEIRRQAVVVLSDGQDTASRLGFDEVLELARRTGVSVYTIAIGSVPDHESSGARRFFSPSDYGMRMLAQETGARSFFPRALKELGGVYGRIAEELSNQYSLAYEPKNLKRDGAFRRVVVQILTRAGLRPRTRSGYYAARLATQSAAQ